MKKISLLMPTRGRPKLAARFIQSVIDYSLDISSIELVIYVDVDDLPSHSLLSNKLDISLIIGPRKTMGTYNTKCFEKATGDVIILVNDDMVIKTLNWDLKINELHNSIEDQIYLAYGNDLFKGKSLCAFPILSRKTCELLKKPYPIEYRGAFIDVHLFDIFKRLEKLGINRTFYMEDIIFEHMHYRLGKADMDQTYFDRGRFDDDQTFVGLTDFRMQNSVDLYKEITGQDVLLKGANISEADSVSKYLVSILICVTRNFLFDRNLPFRWRLHLWCVFIGRTFARLGFLRFLGIN